MEFAKSSKSKILAVVMALALVLSSLALTACSGQSNNSSSSSSSSTSSSEDATHIMFCGSTSLYPIMSSLASSFTDQYEKWNKVDSSLPEKNISIYVAPGGSGVGVSALKEGTCDFGMVARSLKDKEKTELGDYKEYQVAKDALTVSVNASNPITEKMDSMTSDMIRDIFAGKITKWSEVDSSLPDQEIQVYIRDLSGGAYEVFQTNIMGDIQITSAATQSASMTELATNIANNEWAIGYAGYGAYNKANKSSKTLFAMKVDGVECTETNILSGDYKVQRPVMFVGKGEPTKIQQAFIDYIFSDTGREVVESNGYIPAF